MAGSQGEKKKVFVDLALISKGSRRREEIVMINMLSNECVGVASVLCSPIYE